MKIIEAYNRYRAHMQLEHCSYSTMTHFEYYRNSLVEYAGNVDIESLSIDDIESYLMWLLKDRSNNTVRNYAGALRSVLRFCRRKLHLNCVDPDDVPIARREEFKVAYITPKEVSRMIETAQSVRAKFIISFLYASGVRVSELCSLKRADIHNRSFSVIGKGNKIRLCFIDMRTEKLMEEYLATRDDDSPYLIVSHIYKDKITKSTVEYIIKNVRKRSGIPKKITPHTFRHGFATNLLDNGAQIQDVSQMLGHASVQTTMIYRHLSDNSLRNKYQLCHSI